MTKDPIALARQLLAALDQQPAANDDEPQPIDEAALRQKMLRVAEKVRRARNR